MILSARAVDAAIFDMDGVITDSAVVHRTAWKATFDSYLADVAARTGCSQAPFSDEDYLLYVDGKNRDDGVSNFLAARGIVLPHGALADAPDAPTVWGLANRKNVAFQQVLVRDGVKAFPSSVALVRSLQEHGVGTAIISASRNCQAILESAGIGELFPVRVDGVETARLGLPGKPSAAVFLEAARQLGGTPGRSVVVEDALAGVEAGRAGGFGLVIGVDRVGQADQLRAHGADTVVTDLAQILIVP